MVRLSLHNLRAVTLVLLVLVATPAYPWGDKGHEIVAFIAEAHLTEQARKKIKALLPQDNPSLANAATWPDKVGRNIVDMNPFHFINFPMDSSTYDQQRDCGNRNCLIEALTWYRRVLITEDAPLNMRRMALRFIAHLVGDVHQPLHAGHKEDLGGNSINVIFNNKKTNLHSLWDTGLVELELGTSAEVAQVLNGAITPQQMAAWQAGDVKTWAKESMMLARSHAYGPSNGATITDQYVQQALPFIRQRLAQAGVRLVWLLNGDLQ